MAFQCSAKLPCYLLPSGLVAVKLKAIVVKASCVQAFVHDFEGGRLLAHEQNRLPLGEQLGNHVRDGLTFPGSRRTVHHEAPACCRGRDALQLSGVGIQDRDDAFRRSVLLQPVFRDYIEVKAEDLLRPDG